MMYFMPVGKGRAYQVHNSFPSRDGDMTYYIGMITEDANQEGKFYFSSANSMHCFTPKELVEISARIHFLEDFYASQL